MLVGHFPQGGAAGHLGPGAPDQHKACEPCLKAAEESTESGDNPNTVMKTTPVQVLMAPVPLSKVRAECSRDSGWTQWNCSPSRNHQEGRTVLPPPSPHFCFVWGSYPIVLRPHSWFFSQGSLLECSGDQMECWGIKPRLATCTANTLPNSANF